MTGSLLMEQVVSESNGRSPLAGLTEFKNGTVAPEKASHEQQCKC